MPHAVAQQHGKSEATRGMPQAREQQARAQAQMQAQVQAAQDQAAQVQAQVQARVHAQVQAAQEQAAQAQAQTQMALAMSSLKQPGQAKAALAGPGPSHGLALPRSPQAQRPPPAQRAGSPSRGAPSPASVVSEADEDLMGC